MKTVLAHIGRLTQELEHHPFFLALQPDPDLARAMTFARCGLFWVFTFQDIIVLNAELASDPVIKQMLARHQAEDAGHEEWFLEDLEKIFGQAPTNVRSLFSRDTLGVRAGSYGLAGEVFRISDDRLRLVLVEVIESAAGYFFGRVSQFLAESGHTDKLKYFAGVHLQAEAAHDMHGSDHVDELRTMVLPPELHQEAIAMVDRMFAAFIRLADTMHEHQRATGGGA